jgi:hypothetical protein
MIAISSAPTFFFRSVKHMAMTQNQQSFGDRMTETADAAPDVRWPGNGGQAQAAADVNACACAFEPHDAPIAIYNEEAFRYFLEIERKRAEASNRPFLLLLVDLLKTPGTGDIDAARAEALFAALTTSLRETDFVGWYHAKSVIGAVLTQHAHSVDADAQAVVCDRVLASMRKQLPAALAGRVTARVYQLPPIVQD